MSKNAYKIHRISLALVSTLFAAAPQRAYDKAWTQLAGRVIGENNGGRVKNFKVDAEELETLFDRLTIAKSEVQSKENEGLWSEKYQEDVIKLHAEVAQLRSEADKGLRKKIVINNKKEEAEAVEADRGEKEESVEEEVEESLSV